MKKLPYLPEGYEGQLTEAQQKFAQIAVETQIRLRRKGLAVFRDRGRFCQYMFELARGYQYRLQQQSERGGARAKFVSISDRARQLAVALSGFTPSELNMLDKQMAWQWANAGMSEQEDREARCSTGDWPFRPPPLLMLQDSIAELGKASAKLTRASRSGRAKLHAEHWAACEFVRICHATGWSPIRMANGSNEVKHKAEPNLPDAVRCLAAVFEMAGVAESLAKSRAMTVLRALRTTPVPHVVRWTSGWEGEHDEEEWFEVSLHHCVSEQWKGVPNFIPEDRR